MFKKTVNKKRGVKELSFIDEESRGNKTIIGLIVNKKEVKIHGYTVKKGSRVSCLQPGCH
jgi:hypothetical protein